jgi:hypothetical protein
MSMLVLLGAAVLAAAPQSEPVRPIVITAQSIDQARTRLDACLARHCPPNEDIDATLGLAESQLLQGKYHDARKVLLSSLGRNKREARAYPVPVSDLYRANGKVASHLGLDSDYFRSTWGIYRTLKYGLPSEDVRKFSALMEVAEMTYRTRGHERARTQYESIARQARAAGRPDIAALAELRSAVRHLPPNSRWQVNEIKRIAALPGPEMRAPALEAKLALARMAFLEGDERAGQAIQQEIAAMGVKRPILIYSPPYETDKRDTNGVQAAFGDFRDATLTEVSGGPDSVGRPGISRLGSVRSHGTQTFSTWREAPVVDMWVDIAFHITPEGRVADARITRNHGDTYWAQPLLKSLMGRRYTPADPTSPTSRRLERYTFTSGFERKTQSRSESHAPDTRVEFLDLSEAGGGTGLSDSD